MKLAFIFTILCRSLLAATYFVNPDSGNDASAGTATNTAWQNIPGTVCTNGAGWHQLIDGDKLVVKGGTTNFAQVLVNQTWYNGTNHFDSVVLQSGDLFSPAWGSGRAIIDAGVRTNCIGNVGGGQSNHFGIWITGNGATMYGLTIDGFEIRNVPHGGVGLGFDTTTGSACIDAGGNYIASFFTIKRCYLHDAYRNGDDTGHGIEFAGGTNFIIACNIVGTNLGTKGIEPYRGMNGVISNNWIWGTGDHCASLTTCTNIDFCNNVIVGVGPHIHEPIYALGMSGADHCDVWNNLMFCIPPVPQTNCTTCQEWAFLFGPISGGNSITWRSQLGIGLYTTANSNRIVNNTIAYFNDSGDGGSSTAVAWGKDGANTTDISGSAFQNNLVYSNNNAFSGSFNVGNTNAAVGTTVKFNGFFHIGTSEAIMSYYDGSTYHYTNVANYSLPLTFSGNVQTDPLITFGTIPTGLDASWHPNSKFFALTDGSPASVRGTGNTILGQSGYGFDPTPTKFNLDIAGNFRSGWSMGAYEYIGTINLNGLTLNGITIK